MSDTYVIVHGAWHTGQEMEATAEHLRKKGHVVHCPTVAGNNPGDDRSKINLTDAVQSICDYITAHNLQNIRLAGHSYGGMVITGVAHKMPDRIARLVYFNAFVPEPGQCLNDLVPPHYVALFDDLAKANNNAVMMPFPIWREAFINDGDLQLAQSTHALLNPHPYQTFTEKTAIDTPVAAWTMGKSYVNCREDNALPQSLGWHPRLSERLGLYRYVECTGSHETLFTDPAALAAAIEKAGRD